MGVWYIAITGRHTNTIGNLMVEHALHGVRLVLVAIAVTGPLIAFLAECDAIHRCSYFLTGYFTSENEGVKPHGFRAVYPFGFMCYWRQLSNLSVSHHC